VSRELPGISPSGGIGTYTRIVAGALAKRGAETHVLCVHPTLQRGTVTVDGFTLHTASQLQPRGIGRVVSAPATLGRLSQAISVWRELMRLRTRFDVIEAPEFNAEALLIALLSPAPLVIRLHSSAAQLSLHSGGQLARDLKVAIALEDVAIRRAQIVVSTEPNLRQQVADLALDPAHTRPIIYPVRSREPMLRADGPPIIAFVGRLEPRKGPEILIRALPAILARFPNARLRFVGEDTSAPYLPSYASHLRKLAAGLGVAHATEFAGPFQHEDVFSQMASASVCTFPSRWESFGLVAAEAASIGRPVVVSAIPAFEDYVEDRVSGRVVAVDDPDAWAAAIIELLDSPDQAWNMALRLRQRLIVRADPLHVAELVLESYEAAIARARSAPQRKVPPVAG
jgi:glycosyltransferase involved in cell wall biosynthesis